MIPPCKDCPDRTVEPNCHMVCRKYLAFQAEREAEYERRRLRQDVESYTGDLIERNRKRVRKSKRSYQGAE